MEHFFKKLSLLKNDLAPDHDFIVRSKMDIMHTQRESPEKEFYMYQSIFRLREVMSYGFALGITIFFIFIVTNGITGQGLTNTVVKTQEKENLSFNIHLDNARYYEQPSSNVYVVVRENKEK